MAAVQLFTVQKTGTGVEFSRYCSIWHHEGKQHNDSPLTLSLIILYLWCYWPTDSSSVMSTGDVAVRLWWEIMSTVHSEEQKRLLQKHRILWHIFTCMIGIYT